MTLSNCTCCGSHQYKILPYNNKGYAVLDEESNIFSNLKILSCTECGFSHSYPPLCEKKITTFYKKSYSKPGTIHAVSWQDRFMNYKKAVSTRSVAQLNLVMMFKDINNINSVLEIGPGFGDIKKTLMFCIKKLIIMSSKRMKQNLNCLES